MHRYSPLPDSMETLNELAELGLELELLTALPNDTIKTALEVLEKHGHKPHAATTCSAEQKVAYCLANGIDLLVDDAPITLEHAHTAGLPVTALRWGYNSATLDRLAIPHASNWTDLRIVIHQLLGLESE
jgi:phosphoglycolate phosphatase-like HAD superfamily hydrolase